MTFDTVELKDAAHKAKTEELKTLEAQAAKEKTTWLATCEKVRQAKKEADEIWNATIE